MKINKTGARVKMENVTRETQPSGIQQKKGV
jgi:hypothetical protein